VSDLAKRVNDTPDVKAKLYIIAEGLDTLLMRRAPRPKEERHLESVDVLTVFQHWQQVMGHPTAILTEGRRERIKQRLKEGYTVDRMLRAIDGCAASDFHMGRGEHKGTRRYDDLHLILRSGDKLETFEAMPLGPEPGGNRKFLG
jgi:hypothetical protein